MGNKGTNNNSVFSSWSLIYRSGTFGVKHCYHRQLYNSISSTIIPAFNQVLRAVYNNVQAQLNILKTARLKTKFRSIAEPDIN